MFDETIDQKNGRLDRFLPWTIGVCLLLGVTTDNQYLTSLGVLFGVVYAFIWLWWRFSFVRLSTRLEFQEVRIFEGEEIELKLITSNQKFLPLFWVNIVYEIPAGISIKEAEIVVDASTHRGSLRSFWSLGPWQTVARTFTISADERGFYPFGPVRIETGDPFGFFIGRKMVELSDKLIVYPKVYPIDKTPIPAQKPFGESRSVGRLFEDPMRTIGVREWQMGDQMRRIHWAKTAKYQALHSRVYEPIEEEQIMIFLNIATLAQFWHGTFPEMQERAIRVAASLAYDFSEQRLPVGLIANGRLPQSDQPLKLLPGRSPQQLALTLELLAGVTSFATSTIGSLINAEVSRIPWGTTLVIITCITHEALLAQLEDVAAAGREVVLISLAEKPPTELLPGITVYHIPEFDLDDTTVISPERHVA